MLDKHVKLNLKLSNLIQVGFSIAVVDGGFVIAVQVINFLLSYFGAKLAVDSNGIQSLSGLNKITFLIAIINMLNLSVIICRITGLSRGVKYSAGTCYQQAFSRGPALIMLYLLGSAIMLILAIPLMRVVQNPNLIMFLMLSCIPIGILTCIYVVDQKKSPLQAITSTFLTITNKISVNLLMGLSLLYSLPFCLNTIFTTPDILAPYIGLFNALWFLFCHVLTIIVYTGTYIKVNVTTDNKNTTKVIIV